MFLGRYAFEDYVWLVGSADNHHVVLFGPSDNFLGVWHLTDLTFKLFEVVLLDDPITLLMDFILDPLFEAVDVHSHARPFAVAGRYQKVRLVLLVA